MIGGNIDRSTAAERSSNRRVFTFALVAYAFTLALYLITTFQPSARVWGFNIWAHFPLWVPFGLFGFGLATGILIWHFRGRLGQTGKPGGGGRYWYASAGLVVLLGLAFYVFRTQTHFLGDGNLVLTILTSPARDVNFNELGECLIHNWLYDSLSGAAADRALFSYQSISIAAGLLMLIATVLSASRLFQAASDRLLFVLGVASGGFMQLYFGYVENYAVFSLAVGLFVYVALLIVRGKLHRLWIVPALMFAGFLHIVSATQVPAAIYVLLHNSQIGDKLAKASLRVKIALAAVVAIPLLIAFAYFYQSNLFFKTAFVPLVHNRYTIEDYVLFSFKHLADMVNLLFIHFPATLMVVVILASMPIRRLWAYTEYRLFALLLVCVWGGAFIFETKIGMPRDWDLNSYAGLPTVLFGFYFLLDERFRLKEYRAVAVLAIALGVLSLGPRVISQTKPDIAFAQVDSYAQLDPSKNKNLRFATRNYFLQQGDAQAADQELAKWAAYPEEQAIHDADLAVMAGRNNDAIRLYQQAIDLNPLNIPSYIYLGKLLNRLKMYDSSIQVLELAHGMAPRNPSVATNLGYAYWWVGKRDKGEQLCRFAIKLDPTVAKAYYYLANMCRETGRNDEYEANLRLAVTKSDVTPPMLADLAALEAGRGNYQQASVIYRQAIAKGMDSVSVHQEIQKFPPLKQWLTGY